MPIFYHNYILQVGDIFMEEIQSFAAELPYMTAPGNHGNTMFINI
jgi:hypothetical protein